MEAEQNDNSNINTNQKNKTLFSNQPILSQPFANPSNDNSKNTAPFFLMTLEDNNGECKQIKIYENSNPSELAYNFCKENNLDYSSMKYIKKNIKEIQKKFKQNKNELLYFTNDSIKEEEDEEQYNTDETLKELKESLKEKEIENNDINKNSLKKNELLENLLNKKIILSKLKVNQISPMQKKIKQMINRINRNKIISRLKIKDNNNNDQDIDNNEYGVPVLCQRYPTSKGRKTANKVKQNQMSNLGKFYSFKKTVSENLDNNININNSKLNTNSNYISTDQNHRKTMSEPMNKNMNFKKNYKYFKALLYYLNSPQKTNYTSYVSSMKTKSDSPYNETALLSNDMKNLSTLFSHSKGRSKSKSKNKNKKDKIKIASESKHNKKLIKNITDYNNNNNPQNIYLNIKNLKQNFINNKPKEKPLFNYNNLINSNHTVDCFYKDYFDWLVSSKVYNTSRSDDSFMQEKTKFKTYSYTKKILNNLYESSRDKKNNKKKLVRTNNKDKNLDNKKDKKVKIRNKNSKSKIDFGDYLSYVRIGNIKSKFYTQNRLNKSNEKCRVNIQKNKTKNIKKNNFSRQKLYQ